MTSPYSNLETGFKPVLFLLDRAFGQIEDQGRVHQLENGREGPKTSPSRSELQTTGHQISLRHSRTGDLSFTLQILGS